MDRLISVKGTGRVSLKPDIIVITITVESHDYDYEQAMHFATESVAALMKAVESTGLDKKELKTTRFNVNTRYENFRDKDDSYQQRFAGYVCEQDFRLTFAFDTALLSHVLNAIAQAVDVDPTLQIRFSIKDQEAAREELLIQATKNARRKAEILAKAAGVRLGDLVKIDYNWVELKPYSETQYVRERKMLMASNASPEMNPEDIELSDTVSFEWEIK